MPAIYKHHHTVTPAEIDALGHANNVAYLAWMQEAALGHTAAQGWPAERYRQLGRGWVVRAHAIQYHNPAKLGDEVIVQTWVATMAKVSSLRRYRILRCRDGAILATGETKWAFVDYATGQPIRIPPEIAAAFEVVNELPDFSQQPTKNDHADAAARSAHRRKKD
jgi:acyl-CoA thioester hydrolase